MSKYVTHSLTTYKLKHQYTFQEIYLIEIYDVYDETQSFQNNMTQFVNKWPNYVMPAKENITRGLCTLSGTSLLTVEYNAAPDDPTLLLITVNILYM